MSRRAWIALAGALALVGAGALAYDALVETDEERLEVFVDDVTGEVTRGRVQLAQSRWVDLSRQPLEVSALGQSLLYRAGEEAALGARASEALQTLAGANLRVLGSTLAIEGDRATVGLRLLSRERGMSEVEWRLVRDGERWLVARLSVRR